MENSKFHIGLNVTDIDTATEFYRILFGSEPVKTKPGYTKFDLDNPGLVISFIESKKTGPQFGHLGIRVNSYEQLLEKKRQIEQHITVELEEMNTSCCYAVQNKFWVKDPDGYEWEVYHFLEDSDSKGGRNTSGNSKMELAGCC